MMEEAIAEVRAGRLEILIASPAGELDGRRAVGEVHFVALSEFLGIALAHHGEDPGRIRLRRRLNPRLNRKTLVGAHVKEGGTRCRDTVVYAVETKPLPNFPLPVSSAVQ